MMIRSAILALLAFVFVVSTQKLSDSKGSPEIMQTPVYSAEGEVVSRVQNQLLNALAMLEQLQEEPLKVAEKRRNKFEFIRFGRK